MRSVIWKKCVMAAVGLAAVILCAISPLDARAAEEGGMVQPSSAKIYSGMSEDSDIIANLIVGNVFEVAGAENDAAGGIWYKVKTDFGAEGYVKASEMDRLIMDAQAMSPPVAADTGSGNPPPDSGGEEADPGEENAGEDNAVEAAPSGEENAGDDNGGEAAPGDNGTGEAASYGEDNAGEAVPSGEENARDDNAVEAASPDGNPAGEAAPSEVVNAGVEPGSEAVPESDAVGGAGFGKETDSQDTDSAVIGSEEFTVIERTGNSKIHRHGRIDAVLIMIVAGGLVCIIAIAALLKKIVTCVRTEA